MLNLADSQIYVDTFYLHGTFINISKWVCVCSFECVTFSYTFISTHTLSFLIEMRKHWSNPNPQRRRPIRSEALRYRAFC